MRYAIAILLVTLSGFAPALSAKDKSDWVNVQKLQPGTPVLLLLSSGEQLHGTLDVVENAGLRLTMLNRTNNSIGPSRQVDRTSIRKLVRFRRPKLMDSGFWILAGTMAGGAIGATSGAIYDGTHHDNKTHWLSEGLGGTAIGFLASCAAVAGADTFVLLFRHSTVVYENDRLPVPLPAP